MGNPVWVSLKDARCWAPALEEIAVEHPRGGLSESSDSEESD
jgi:hypothetical protein